MPASTSSDSPEFAIAHAAFSSTQSPLFPASGPATNCFKGLHAKSKFLAAAAIRFGKMPLLHAQLISMLFSFLLVATPGSRLVHDHYSDASSNFLREPLSIKALIATCELAGKGQASTFHVVDFQISSRYP